MQTHKLCIESYCVPIVIYDREIWYLSASEYCNNNILLTNCFKRRKYRKYTVPSSCWPMPFIINPPRILFYKSLLDNTDITDVTLFHLKHNYITSRHFYQCILVNSTSWKLVFQTFKHTFYLLNCLCMFYNLGILCKKQTMTITVISQPLELWNKQITSIL